MIKCPICDNEWQSLDCQHYVRDLIKQIDTLKEEHLILLDAAEDALGFINDLNLDKYELDTDEGQACCRVYRRKLNEAMGKAEPRLLMEKPRGQKLYSLHYRELREQLDEMKDQVKKLIKLLPKEEIKELIGEVDD